MKRLFLSACMVMALLFSATAFAVGIPDGDGVVMTQPADPAPAWGAPALAAAPPPGERMCPVASLDTMTYAPLTYTAVAVGPVAKTGHFDTGDPKSLSKS